MKRLIIVFHEPGDPHGYEMVERLAKEVASELGLEVKAVPMKSVESKTADIKSGDLVFALLPFRGGHLHEVEEYSRERGARFLGKIPNDLIASSILKRASGCDKLTLLYWPAKRFVELQREDLEYIARRIEESGISVDLLTECKGDECRGCVAATSLFPGRLTREASHMESKGRVRVVVPYLLDAVWGDVRSFLAGIVRRAETF